jgi:thiol-disulfide isomerase/thioredoxin
LRFAKFLSAAPSTSWRGGFLLAPSMRRIALTVVLLVAALVGCESSSTPVAAAKPSDNVNLVIGDGQTLAKLIAGHEGQVVFVDCWATWCVPCVQGFPDTVALAKKYRHEGLATIAVSFDELDDEPKVRDFLSQQGADFENLLSKHDSMGQKTAEDFDIEVLPQYRLYDRRGKLREKWEGKSEEIEQKIQELLAEK